jgi:hypothetical protein
MPAETMPDQEPELTDPERLMLHLVDVTTTGLACPVCQSHNWDVLGLVVAADAINSRPGALTGRPMMQVVCRTCGYLMHFLWELIRQKQFPSGALEALRQMARETEVSPPATSEDHHGE